MLIEKYESVNLFQLVPLERDPVLDELDHLLDDDELFQAVKDDTIPVVTREKPHRMLGVVRRRDVLRHLIRDRASG